MISHPLYEFGGSGPVLHLAVANGFPPPTYAALLQPLTAHYRVLSLPPRALWPQVGEPPETVGSWRDLADDVLDGLRERDLRDVIAVGHSFGAVVSMLAVLAEPERFRALVLLDPTILPKALTDAIKTMRAHGEVPRLPLVDGALKRKQYFVDVDEAYTYWRGKPLFKDWSDAAVRLYAESLTKPAANGGLELAWPREWEAYYYLSVDADVWDYLPQINGLRPTLIIRGGSSDTYLEESADQTRILLPDANHETLPGYGHLFPLAAPDTTRQMIVDWLNKD